MNNEKHIATKNTKQWNCFSMCLCSYVVKQLAATDQYVKSKTHCHQKNKTMELFFYVLMFLCG